MDRETITQRREIEDRALSLGEEREEIKRRLTENTDSIIEFLRGAAKSYPLHRLAQLLGVGRATLYRWQGGPTNTTTRWGGEDD